MPSMGNGTGARGGDEAECKAFVNRRRVSLSFCYGNKTCSYFINITNTWATIDIKKRLRTFLRIELSNPAPKEQQGPVALYSQRRRDVRLLAPYGNIALKLGNRSRKNELGNWSRNYGIAPPDVANPAQRMVSDC